MKIVKLIVRILLGLMMFVFGLNKFLHFMPEPEMEAGPALDYMIALGESGFIMPIVAIVEIIGGALLLIGRFKALALVLLVPIMLNAFLFHLFLDPAGIGGSAVAMVMIIYLMFTEIEAYKGILKA